MIFFPPPTSSFFADRRFSVAKIAFLRSRKESRQFFFSPLPFSAENKFSCRRSGKGEKLNREEDGPRRTEESLYFRGKSRVSVGEKRWREAIVGYSARAATREEKFFLVHIYIYASGTACRL